MKNQKINTESCTSGGNSTGGHEGWYDKIGFSPCGEYVSHESNKTCDVINGNPANDAKINTDPCMCMTVFCLCGEFLSHKVSEPCTAKV